MSKITLICKNCGHANEGERIYCHSCGVKLDRSILPPEETIEETHESVRKRVQQIVKPKSGFWVGSLRTSIETVVLAVMAAALIQICRPPDEVPPPLDKTAMVEKPMITLRLSQAMLEQTPQRITIPEEMANLYLACTLKPKSGGLVDDEFKFLRAFVHFKKSGKEPGVCQISSEQSIFDFPLYTRISYRLGIVDNKLNAVCVGGSLGRLPVHPKIMEYADLLFESLWTDLAKERTLIGEMQSVEVNEKEIVLLTKSRNRM